MFVYVFSSRYDPLEGVIVHTLDLILVLFLVLLNGFFVAAEFAIVKVRTTRIAQIQNKRGKAAQKVLSNLDAYLSATQLGITLASLGLGWVGEPAIAELIDPVLKAFNLPEWAIHTVSFAIAFSLITFLHIVLGEMAPKSLAIRKAESTTLWTAAPLNLFYKLFKPFIFLLNGSANLTLKLFGIELSDDTQQAHTEEEIRMLIKQSHKSGEIDQTELTLLDNIFDFTERVAREVMVPRVNMTCLYAGKSFEENLSVMKQTHHTRFPLCGNDKDEVLGIIHIRDVYQQMAEGKTPSLSGLARPALMVPETMEIKDILRNLQKKRTGMAIVVDEYGGTSGLVTTEDIIEEIFGEIQDEFDNEQPFFEQKGNETSIDSHLLIEEVNDYFQLDIEDPDNDTIGGWIFSQLEKVPEIGDRVSYDPYTFEVQEVHQRRVTRILVKPVNHGSENNNHAIAEQPSI
ncbi:HlyC/CorC family transporter [Paenactinomyces guangxiensis]|uniref:HlyC/CorC family transporter n=1 Tax=Paenactinomyces guangxiensis TaxID=1490290 RepID=A0A7W1WST6_9BACL|nr:HlyC/CorC family transporter [Paenactinomyces guangxiensis]MBH8592551.1 HlyC/CorC family transporter [Paenactinomyces guangxiensis]